MKKLLLIAVIACACLLTSCSTHFYSSSNANLAQTEVVLSQKNFKVVGQAEGVATVTQVFGIGGCTQKQVRTNAVAEMYKNAKLTGAQAIINVNVKKAVTGFTPIYTRTTYAATGTIVEFTE